VILYKCQLFWRCGVTIELSLNYFGGVVIHILVYVLFCIDVSMFLSCLSGI
jgi:hypothetical protein